jgi:hypothetical protein
MKLKFNSIQLSLIAFIFLTVSFLACNKEGSSEGTPAEEEAATVASTESDADADNIFNGLFDDVMGVSDEVGLAGTGVFGKTMEANSDGTTSNARLTVCPDVTVVLLNAPALFPKKIILDFGATGCTGRDGHLRRGKIINVYTNRLTIPGATASTTFDGFYFDGIKVEGTHKITNVAETNALAKKWKVEVVGAKLTAPNGDFTEWNRTNVITQIENLSPTNVRDIVMKIEGYGSGHTKRNGIIVSWAAEIIEPLIKRFNCRWIVRGKIRIKRANLTADSRWIAVLDYGAGTCDNKATLTVDGRTKEIILR